MGKEMMWEILIGLSSIATAIFFGLNGIIKRIATKTDIIAIFFAFSKPSAEERTVTLEGLKEGYEFAHAFVGLKGQRRKSESIVSSSSFHTSS